MQLDPRLWYVRWFLFSHMVWSEFSEISDSRSHQQNTNLCYFVRVTLFWCPLVIILHLMMVAFAVSAVTAIPVYFYGGIGYAWILGTVAAVVGLFAAVKTARQWQWKRTQEAQQRINRAIAEKAEKQVELLVESLKERKPVGPSFFEIVWKYLVATKQKICPTIVFETITLEGDRNA